MAVQRIRLTIFYRTLQTKLYHSVIYCFELIRIPRPPDLEYNKKLLKVSKKRDMSLLQLKSFVVQKYKYKLRSFSIIREPQQIWAKICIHKTIPLSFQVSALTWRKTGVSCAVYRLFFLKWPLRAGACLIQGALVSLPNLLIFKVKNQVLIGAKGWVFMEDH